MVSKKVEKRVEKKKRKLPKNVVLKDGVWYVRKSFRLDGKAKVVWRVCKERTPAAAATILTQIEAELNLARSGRQIQSALIRDVIKTFIEDEVTPAIFKDGQKIAGRIAIDTVLIILARLNEEFGHRDITSLSYGEIHSYKLKRLRTPVTFPKANIVRQRSLRSVNYDLVLLRQVCNYAISRRILHRSPFLDGKGLIETQLEARRYLTWTREEEAKALELCTGKRRHMKAVIILLTDGGFRSGELLRALWADVNFKENYILARHYKGNRESLRKIYLTARAKKALIEWREIQKTDGRISDRSKIIGFDKLQTAWENIRKAIGRPDLHLHDLRHVFATRLNERAVPLPNISRMLGHSNVKTTEIYINPQDSDLKNAFAVLEENS
jgi:integrase